MTTVPSGAEVICVGTELLLGDILNSNAQFLARELAQLGIPHYFQTVVGDNMTRLHHAIEVASKRSSILIFTGGLGPTPDDLTTEGIATYFDTPLTERSEVLEDITRKYAARGREMAPSNRKQALLPVGADVLPNPLGTAPGLLWEPQPNLILMTFPGVPSEMHAMWQTTAVPFLKQRGYGQTLIHSLMLRFWGIAEATLAEKVGEFLELENPTVAPYAGHGEVRLRVSARAASEPEAEALIEPVAQQLQAIAGLDYYGSDEDTLSSVVGRLLLKAGQTLSVAESCTGGGLGQMLTAVSGSSAYFLGGVISYDNAVKVGLLGVSEADLETHGAVSDAVAQQMAEGVRSRLNTTWGLSITGIAGPDGGTDEKPVGLVYIGLAGPSGVKSDRFQFGAHRKRDFIRHLSSCTALDLLRRELLES
ncbi:MULTISPECIES: competence/damage-inducible protein A [unclassified Leptolyngbya]|uniref:competence/damage-inducible protein A n=1 Tax=unclassified Leptolyngbya TaxID=2650499 RepID=UPI001684DD5F|nr:MULTISPECIES: competence/damage-inducible protein A [unclassified Leptolyngbya]MBD1910176.1 competence/damage-inducible protein A [Leptolyngbya sp. FACHB-8]MBD2154074.1 competence/damage-inducible protein A [Leptolyngbya sp. FACHB-16]